MGDVSWNDIPSYHTHFDYGNEGKDGNDGGSGGGGGGGGSGRGDENPWCSMM